MGHELMEKIIKVSEVKVLKCDKCGSNMIFKDKKMVCVKCDDKLPFPEELDGGIQHGNGEQGK
jgi:DNA-directed RNA polymerase subunit RPC12/RpoP